MPRRTMLFPLMLVIGLSIAPFARGYEFETHGKATRETVDLIKTLDQDKTYAEVYKDVYKNLMDQGAQDEDFGNVDGNNRAFRHYYDPDQTGKDEGLKWQDYFTAWYYIGIAEKLGEVASPGSGRDRPLVTEPRGGYYDNALDWARNSGMSDDTLNWDGAIATYDYTESSKNAAYLALGHVVHLLQDMAEPDHVYCLAHPGSTKRYPLTDMVPMPGADSVYFGYEGLVENYIAVLRFPGKSIQKREYLENYFDEMARYSKKAVTGKFVVPLGLDHKNIKCKAGGLIPVDIDYRDVPIMPNIDDNVPAERNRYLDLAKELLIYSAELGAGLIEQFYDIVNQPPYVKRVCVTQETLSSEDVGRYETELQDVVEKDAAGIEHVTRRQIDPAGSVNDSFVKGKEALIVIEFGPEGKMMDEASIKVTVGGKEVKGKMSKPLTWEGKFTPELPEGVKQGELGIEITARDAHNHYKRLHLPNKNYELDSQPLTPAKVGVITEPYPWKDYEPGPDRNHKIKVHDPAPVKLRPSIFSIYIGGSELVRLMPASRSGSDGKDKYGFADSSDNMIIPAQFDEALEFSEGLAAVRVGDKWGYVNEEGKVVIKPRYEEWPRPFSEGLASVEVRDPETGGSLESFIDKAGNTVIDLHSKQFTSLRDFHEGLVPFKSYDKDYHSGEWGYLDKQGQVAITPAFKPAMEFSEGLAAVIVDSGNKWGFIDKQGKVVIEPQFDQVWPFTEGKAMVKIDKDKSDKFILAHYVTKAGIRQVSCIHGDLRYIDKEGKLLEGLWFEVKPGWEFYHGRALMKIEGKYGYINEAGKLVIEASYDNAKQFSEKLAAVQVGGKYGYIDTAGKMVIQPRLNYAESFKNGLARIVTGGTTSPTKESYIDKTGKEVKIDKKKAELEFSEGLAAVSPNIDIKVGNSGRIELPDPDLMFKQGYVDAKGKIVIPAKFDEARKFSEGLACVGDFSGSEELFGYIDKKGAYVIKPQFGRVITHDYDIGVDFSEGLAAAAVPGNICFGYIDRTGNWVIRPQFNTASEFREGVAFVSSCGRLACIDKNGNGVPLRWWRVYEQPEVKPGER